MKIGLSAAGLADLALKKRLPAQEGLMNRMYGQARVLANVLIEKEVKRDV
jgi:hypothetical protein